MCVTVRVDPAVKRAIAGIHKDAWVTIEYTDAVFDGTTGAWVSNEVEDRGHFPSEQAALKCGYLAIMALDPAGKGRADGPNDGRTPLNPFEIAFDGRPSIGRR